MAQLRENNVSFWRDNFMRDLQSADGATRTAGAPGWGRKARARFWRARARLRLRAIALKRKSRSTAAFLLAIRARC
ncbi:MAG: Alpha,alpha-trehalose-phosphate synthase [UDP-forming] (EC [uncultured Paraburkholderia sp.]|nr:MAG: Alpha,alpha-trehalose-phosphate synthase [UDP-forming] (EC [uncultured Paraburkholderia sp.]